MNAPNQVNSPGICLFFTTIFFSFSFSLVFLRLKPNLRWPLYPLGSFYRHSNTRSPQTSESVQVLSSPGHFLWGLCSVSGDIYRVPQQDAAFMFYGNGCSSELLPPSPLPAATSGHSEIPASEVGGANVGRSMGPGGDNRQC